jgi:metallo-beta-lactamase superfamily protein
MLRFAAAALAATLAAAGGPNGLKRMYVLDCGRLIAKDQSRGTPGVNAGQPREFSNNCYLFRHERGALLWETGVPDSVAEHKDGLTTSNGAIVMFRDKTLKGQIEGLWVKPDDITYVAIAHSHGDHIGNAKAFAKSKTLMQKLEHESAMKMIPKPLNDDQNVETLSGDRHVFGDGPHHHFDAGPHAWAPVAACEAAKDRCPHPHWRPRALPVHVGQQGRPALQFQQGAVASLDRAHCQAARRAQGATLDRPRQGHHRQDLSRSEVLRVALQHWRGGSETRGIAPLASGASKRHRNTT